MAIRTIQATIKQTVAQIEREERKLRGDKKTTMRVETRTEMLKELYVLCENEKHQRLAKWIKEPTYARLK